MDEKPMISTEDYYMGRQNSHADELSSTMREAAGMTVQRVNALLLALDADQIPQEINPKTGTIISSGWRPQSINNATPGAAIRSKHLYCLACDLFDPDGMIDNWCMEHQNKLAEIGLWLEHPSATKGWCHVQVVAPRSGSRVFYP